MNTKRYFSALIIALILLVVAQRQISVPNQEIVVQFTNKKVSSNDAQNTIAIVKNQLQTLGIDNIRVHKLTDGKLSLTYYSDIDIVSIKNTLLSEEKKLELGYTYQENESNRLPNDKSNNYNLDVYKILKNSNTGWDFEGILVLELKPEGDRFSNLKMVSYNDKVDDEEFINEVDYKLHYNTVTSRDNSLHKIPEVRAGPVT